MPIDYHDVRLSLVYLHIGDAYDVLGQHNVEFSCCELHLRADLERARNLIAAAIDLLDNDYQ